MKAKHIIGAMLTALAFTATSCSDDDDYSVATGNIITLVETGDAAVTATTATTTGTVLDLSGYAASSYTVGVVYGTAQDPTATGRRQAGALSAEGTVTTELSGLTKGATYYYATFVTLQGKVTRYGDVKTFTTADGAFTLSLDGEPTSVGAHLVANTNMHPSVINAGEETLEGGFRLSTSAADVQNGRDYAVTGVIDRYLDVEVSGLLPGTTYYYAAYYKMGDGRVFSQPASFTTASKSMEYVDLGLSVMWAKYNIGAEDESQPGGLYGYGDVSGLKTSEYLTQYAEGDIAATDADIVASIAAAIDGDATMKSQMPTEAQFQELLTKTTHAAANVGGVDGIRFTANNGNSIFLPAAGYRDGETVTAEGLQGLYWLGTANAVNGDYANTISFQGAGVAQGVSKRSLGLAVRSVRQAEPVPVISVDPSKLIVGDLEGNGRVRIEIFNLYGAGTANDPGINTSQIRFEKNMVVRFKLSGLNGNFKSDVLNENDELARTFTAGLEFADESWDPAYWSGFNNYKYDAVVTGDGEYVVWMETGGNLAEGAAVFTIDINELGASLADVSQVKVESLSVAFDVDDINYYVDNSKLSVGDLEGNGRIRVEIYNEYGSTNGQVDYQDINFTGMMVINYTISGIDGNLIGSAPSSFTAQLMYAAGGWNPSYWGGTAGCEATITGDGTYEVVAPLTGESKGAVVWVIDHYDLGANLVDASKVQVTINSITIPGKK